MSGGSAARARSQQYPQTGVQVRSSSIVNAVGGSPWIGAKIELKAPHSQARSVAERTHNPACAFFHKNYFIQALEVSVSILNSNLQEA
jgi:hypothetical protein